MVKKKFNKNIDKLIHASLGNSLWFWKGQDDSVTDDELFF